MQLDFFDSPKAQPKKANEPPPPPPRAVAKMDTDWHFLTRPRAYSVVKQGYTTTILNEEVRHS